MKAKTTVTTGNQVKRNWILFDLSGKTLGRAATEIAAILMGKNNPSFSYHRDDGDYVVAINATELVVTGKILKQKIYYRHTGYAGNLKSLTLKELMQQDPRRVIKLAVYGMLPKNKLRDIRLTRLRVFTDSNHKYADKIGK